MAAQDHDWCRALDGSYADRVREAVSRLDRAHENGDITTRDWDRIHDLLAIEAGHLANATLQNRAQVLYKTPARSETPLVEHDTNSLESLLGDFRNGAHDDVKDDGIGVSNYQKALRKFYRHHDDLGIADPMEIEIDNDEGRDLQPKDLLYRDEVDAIFNQNRDLRDRAMFALMLATGQRNDAVRTLRMKHVEMDDRTMTVYLNETEGALKGASGSVPLLWSKHYVREWYQHHPYRDDDEAALFPPAKGAVPEEERLDPLETDGVTKLVGRMADRAGIEKRVYPHLLKATCITRMAAKGVSEQTIKQMAGWSLDSSQFETYNALADDINDDRLRDDLGYPTSEGETPVLGRPTLETCPNTGCGDSIPTGRDTCPTCGFDLSAPTDADGPEPDASPHNPIAAAIKRAVDERGEDEAGDLLADAVDEITDYVE